MKEKIRQEILEKRRSMPQEVVVEKSNNVIQNLIQLEDFRRANRILFYLSFDNEVETKTLVRELLEKKEKTIIITKIENSKDLALHKISSYEDLQPGPYGILEPAIGSPVRLEDVDLIIVPGIAFDNDGNRVGYGKGYYDELLKTSRAKNVALAYDFQIVPAIPAKEHDIPMDIIITEGDTIICTNSI